MTRKDGTGQKGPPPVLHEVILHDKPGTLAHLEDKYSVDMHAAFFAALQKVGAFEPDCADKHGAEVHAAAGLALLGRAVGDLADKLTSYPEDVFVLALAIETALYEAAAKSSPAVFAEAFTNAERRLAARKPRQTGDDAREQVIGRWHALARRGVPERERAADIVRHTGLGKSQVYAILKPVRGKPA